MCLSDEGRLGVHLSASCWWLLVKTYSLVDSRNFPGQETQTDKSCGRKLGLHWTLNPLLPGTSLLTSVTSASTRHSVWEQISCMMILCPDLRVRRQAVSVNTWWKRKNIQSHMNTLTGDRFFSISLLTHWSLVSCQNWFSFSYLWTRERSCSVRRRGRRRSNSGLSVIQQSEWKERKR